MVPDTLWRGIATTIQHLEEKPQGFAYGAMAFLSIAFLRTVLEGVLEGPHRVGHNPDPLTGLLTTAHYMLGFLVFFLSVILAIWAVSGPRVAIRPLTRIALLGCPILLLPPLLDGLITGGAGFHIYYQHQWGMFPSVFLHSFNPLVTLPGISPGQRVEVFLICLWAGAYVWLKSRNAIRAGLAFLAAYSVICLYEFFPAIWVSLATGVFGIAVPEGRNAAVAIMMGSDNTVIVYVIELHFALLYLLMAGMLGIIWWFCEPARRSFDPGDRPSLGRIKGRFIPGRGEEPRQGEDCV